MQPLTLLESLLQRGATVRADGDIIRVKPSRVLTDADREAIRENRPALLQLLSTPAVHPNGGTELPPDGLPHEADIETDLPAPSWDAAAGLWIRPDGFVVVTRDTLAAVEALCKKQQAAKKASEVKAA